VRDGGIVRDAAILSAIGVGPDGRRRLLGVSAAVSAARRWLRRAIGAAVGSGAGDLAAAARERLKIVATDSEGSALTEIARP